MPLETLNLTVISIDEVEREFAVLECDFGEGYSAGALVGAAGGTHNWKLSSGALPDDDAYGTISGDNRFTYLWNFYQARMAEGNGAFIIAFRSKNYHAKFVDKKITMQAFSSTLFGGGVDIKQHRVSGFTYAADGSIP